MRRAMGVRAAVLGLGLAIGLGLTGPAARAQSDAAQSEAAVFDVQVAGVKAATLSVTAQRNAAAYAVRAVIQSSGVVRLVRRVHFEASARGAQGKSGYVPAAYTESADTGQRQSDVKMTYADGVPQVLSYSPAPDPAATDAPDPSSLGGTLDPATALYAALRDVAAGQACDVTWRTFDGRRLAQVTLGPATPQADGGLRCAGEYQRLAGFTAKEMADKVRFPFDMTYAPLTPDRLRVVEVSLDTIFGKARLLRR